MNSVKTLYKLRMRDCKHAYPFPSRTRTKKLGIELRFFYRMDSYTNQKSYQPKSYLEPH